MVISESIQQFEYIIFDLGGVVIDIDYSATTRAFEQLDADNFEELYSQAMQSNLFDRFETGQISSQHFINLLKEYLPKRLTPNEVVSAWNAMILDFQPGKLDFLETVKTTHKVALLSNTNDIHEEKVRRQLKKVSNQPLEHYFHHTLLSHEIKARKPNETAFLIACEQLGAKPGEVLFIDDSLQHIEGAKKVGISAIHFPQNGKFV
jgi:HAD superfamily hydrolase (TIGR01509 family)